MSQQDWGIYFTNWFVCPFEKLQSVDQDMLTLREAAEYFHIGEKKMRQIVDDNMDASFLLESVNRVIIKRKLFEEYLDRATVI